MPGRTPSLPWQHVSNRDDGIPAIERRILGSEHSMCCCRGRSRAETIQAAWCAAQAANQLSSSVSSLDMHTEEENRSV